MLTVLIETKNSEEGLAKTLASLVSGAVQGLVRDVVLLDRGSTDQTRRIAEHAGCHVFDASFAGAIRQAKGEWLLLIEPGARLGEGWVDAVSEHVAYRKNAARFTRATMGEGFMSRVFSRRRALADGLVILKSQVLSIGGDSSDAIAKGVSASRLRSEIYPASGKGRASFAV